MTKKRPISAARQKRLRPFFWNKLSATSLDSTIWNDIDHTVHFDLNDLEGTFTLDANAGNVKAAPAPKLSQKKQNVVTLLDINRANHIGKSLSCALIVSHAVYFAAIMLSRIKRSLPEIRNAVTELDDDKLSIDDLRAMSRYLPTREEVSCQRADWIYSILTRMRETGNTYQGSW